MWGKREKDAAHIWVSLDVYLACMCLYIYQPGYVCAWQQQLKPTKYKKRVKHGHTANPHSCIDDRCQPLHHGTASAEREKVTILYLQGLENKQKLCFFKFIPRYL